MAVFVSSEKFLLFTMVEVNSLLRGTELAGITKETFFARRNILCIVTPAIK